MLTGLLIKNLAVIENLRIDFKEGFTALTGETGAGKSILVDALFMILGARASKDIIRKGEKSVFVEASFYIPECKDEALCDYICDDYLIISREINIEGKNVVKINSRPANTAVLKEISKYLISIHSQNDNQVLFNEELHYKYLDNFGNLKDEYEGYLEAYKEYTDVSNELKKTLETQTADEGRLDYLNYVKKEIENSGIEPDEEEKLKDKKKRIKEAEQIKKAVESAYYALFEGEYNACGLIKEAADFISRVDSLETFSQKLNDLREEVLNITDEIQAAYEDNDSEYNDIDEIEKRLDVIYKLKSKYGGSVEAVFQKYNAAVKELFETENLDNKIDELQKAKHNAMKKMAEKAEVLTKKRKHAAGELSVRIEKELRELMMPNARFEVVLIENDKFTKSGKESVCFMFCANAGMELQPLMKIASGGEISRVNLAIKSVLYDIDPACAFVFDEIDVGISGRAAQKTGEKMYSLSKNNQILCVTHLSQIAAMADNHLLVLKDETSGITKTTIKYVENEKRAEELARMIGGVEVTPLTLKNAEETLLLASEYKRSLEV